LTSINVSSGGKLKVEKNLSSKLFLIFLGCSLILLLTLFWSYLPAIVLGLLAASVSYPLHKYCLKVTLGRQTAASALLTLLVLLILVVPVSWFVVTLSEQAFDFYNKTRSAVSVAKVQELVTGDTLWGKRIRMLGKKMGFEFTAETVEEIVKAVGKQVGFFLYKQIRSAATNVVNLFIHFFLMMVLVYYLFRDGPRLKRYLIELIPLPVEQLEKVASKFHEMARAIIVGNGLSGIIQGILGGVGFYLFGLPSPFLWGTVIGFLAFLPIIGGSLVFIPATAILLIGGDIGMAVGFLIYNGCYSAFIEYLVKPRLIGKGMQMNALLVFIGIIGGIKVFGIMGIIYGPLIITVFLTLAEIYRLEYRPQFG